MGVGTASGPNPLPSQPHHLHGPSHSRPPAAMRIRVPPVSAHVGYITVQGATGTSPRSRSLTPMDTARATWILVCGWWKCSTAQPPSTPTHNRHTQGSHWYVGGGHARAVPGHARAYHGHARARHGHARASQSARPRGHRHTHTQIQVGARTREFPYSGCPYSTRRQSCP